MKILELRAENFMRLQVVQITPEGHLIQITGANGQGKTSTIDAIWSALGGADATPEDPIHTGKKSARVEVKLGDEKGVSLIVERSFTEKGSYLTVKSPDGGKFAKPQQMMDALMGSIGFDPLAFMRLDAKEQFAMLRKIVKIEVDIDALDRRRLSIYEARTALTRSLANAKARVDAIKVPELPEEAPNIDALLAEIRKATTHNIEVDRNIQALTNAKADLAALEANHLQMLEKAENLKSHIEDASARIARLEDVPPPPKIDVNSLTAKIEAAKPIIEGFRQRELKINADAELSGLEREHTEKTDAIAEIDKQKAAALAAAKMPVEGFAFNIPEGGSLKDGFLTYKGHPLRQASGAEQLQVSAAVGVALNPKLRVLLCRDGSLLDSKSLAALAHFAEKNDMQIFLERVDESGEIGVVIEDGHVKGQEELVAEFLREEAQPATAEKPKAAPADPERLARAHAYLHSQIAKLPEYRHERECDQANATVKHMLQAFPDLFAQKWTPAYLETLKRVGKRKAI